MGDKPLVKFNNQWWVLETIRNGMAIIWRNGSPAIVPINLIQTQT